MRLFLFSFLCCLQSYAQSFDKRHPNLTKTTHQIDTSKKEYTSILLNNSEFLKDSPCNGAELIGYFNNNRIQKIELTGFLSNGQQSFHYYYQNGKLFYVLEIFSQYDYDFEKNKFNYDKTEVTFEGKYLFLPNFDYETRGHNRFEDETLDPEKTLKDEANDYLEKLKSVI